MQTKRKTKSGFTLVEIMIVVAIIGLLAAIAIPNFIRARVKSQQNGCINNLRQIDGAKQQWALEEKKSGSDVPTADDIKAYLGRGTGGSVASVTCPADNKNFDDSYTIRQVDTTPICKINGAEHMLTN